MGILLPSYLWFPNGTPRTTRASPKDFRVFVNYDTKDWAALLLKRREIKNRRNTVSFNHLNYFQEQFSFCFKWKTKIKRKKKFWNATAFIVPLLHSMSITLFLTPSPGVDTATSWDGKSESQARPFSCTYLLLLDTKNPLLRERGEAEVLFGMALKG